MTLAQEIEDLADGPIEAIVLGEAGWGGTYGLEAFDIDEEHPIPWEIDTRIYTWAEARAWLNHDYNRGHGAPNLPQFCAWSARWVMFPDQYDGATNIERVPRNPEVPSALMPGG